MLKKERSNGEGKHGDQVEVRCFYGDDTGFIIGSNFLGVRCVAESSLLAEEDVFGGIVDAAIVLAFDFGAVVIKPKIRQKPSTVADTETLIYDYYPLTKTPLM